MYLKSLFGKQIVNPLGTSGLSARVGSARSWVKFLARLLATVEDAKKKGRSCPKTP